MNQYSAIVIGATGLVGTQLVQLLLKDNRFSTVNVFSRRSTGLLHHQLQEHIIDFDKEDLWQHLVKGDVLFSTLGTTLKKAGNKTAQYKIDYTYQFKFAKAAALNGVPIYVLVSSAMANENSKLFYTRMKGELERDIRKLSFEWIHIIQPGMISGDRKESRPGEKIGIQVVQILNQLGIAKKYKPIDAMLVAKAMINASFKYEKSVDIISMLDVFEAAREK